MLHVFHLLPITTLNLSIRKPTHEMPENNPVQDLLAAFDDTVYKARGAVYEGDIFSTLRSSPYVVRSYEFAPADGLIACSREFDTNTNFADRFRRLFEDEHAIRKAEKKGRALAFDVKSKVSEVAGKQTYLTRGNQRQIVAFYLGMRASDPGFVELIPNFAQGTPDDGIYHAVNTSRMSRLPPAVYRLDLCSAPHRMPLHMLLEAIRRMRDCALGICDYTNPWTLVTYSNWRPLAIDEIASLGTRSLSPTSLFMPAEDTEHFSACRAVLEIQRIIKTNQTKVPIELDFVGLQPLLADFKLVLDCPSLRHNQVFVQHKLDVRDRSIRTPLNKVAVGRSCDTNIRYWFTPFERFDYLFYEFNNISPGPGKPRVTEIFFIPECEIPDEFYETTMVEASFERQEFQRYRMVMDKDGEWLDRVIAIILEEKPRRSSRPLRPGPVEACKTDSSDEPIDGVDSMQALSLHGRAAYSRISTHCTRQFFGGLMLECAERGSGLLFALSHENPSGEFGYCRYRWSKEEQSKFLKDGIPPRTISDLSGITNVLPLCFYTRDLECTFQGPEISSANYRRLAACNFGRLIIWNLTGPDDSNRPGPLVVVPSKDISATEGQRALFVKNLVISKKTQHSNRTPSVSAVLESGLAASDYTVGASGPLVYGEHRLDALWTLCEKFSQQQSPIEHPKGRFHDPSAYLIPLSALHERHAREDLNQPYSFSLSKRKHSASS